MVRGALPSFTNVNNCGMVIGISDNDIIDPSTCEEGVAKSTDFDFSSGVVRGLKTGTVNVNQVTGFHMETPPFGCIKNSGPGIKEGVLRAMKNMSTMTDTFFLPW